MHALLYANFDMLTDAELPAPRPAEDEVLLRVAACGICGSELESFKHRSPRRPPPLVFGHEFCGVVEETGAGVTGFARGDRVVSNSLVTCGKCVRCRRGDGHLCARRQLFGMHRAGAFAEFVAVPAACLIPWPASLPAETACLAEPLGNGIHMVGLTASLAPRTVLVIGAGPIGLLTQQAYRVMTGARVIIADMNEDRLKIAAELGADRTVAVGKEDVAGVTRSLTEGEGADVVIDAVGSERTKVQSLQTVRPGGAAVWIGLSQDEVKISSYALTVPEVCVHGAYGARIGELRTAVDLLSSGKIVTRPWIKTAPLGEGGPLFRRMLAAQGEDIKGVIIP